MASVTRVVNSPYISYLCRDLMSRGSLNHSKNPDYLRLCDLTCRGRTSQYAPGGATVTRMSDGRRSQVRWSTSDTTIPIDARPSQKTGI